MKKASEMLRGVLRRAICLAVRLLLALRYRVRVIGAPGVLAKGRHGILLLPTHPALIDPVILLSRLHPSFEYRALADGEQVVQPILSRLADLFGVIRMPTAGRDGAGSVEGVARAIEECGRRLARGENVMLYPAGHILRAREEDLGANSGVETVLKAAPQARVVLVRVRGLWGSALSRADGGYPDLALIFKRCVRALLANLLFFTPRRPVTVELLEPVDLPRTDRTRINAAIERVFNDGAPPNTYVPYLAWEKGGIRTVPEPAARRGTSDAAAVPPAVRTMVTERLRELCGRDRVEPGHRLSNDLGLDSLSRLELTIWVEQEFGFNVPSPDMLETVQDVLDAAAGQTLADRVDKLAPVSRVWFETGRRAGDAAAEAAPGDTIAAAFLARARATPGAAVLADQTAGVRTYRDVVTALFLLKPWIESLPGERVGILLPASSTASILFLATLFAGKTPVMLNWTAGERSIDHVVGLMELKAVVTAKKLIARLKGQGTAFGAAAPAFVFVEDFAGSLGRPRKLAAWARAHLSWRGLDPAVCAKTAVVLFTSGSESLPKAVPLSHGNLLANVRDVAALRALRRGDALIGFLPPFHSFGLTLTVVFPLVTGVRAVYHANPTEGGTLASLIRVYGVTLLPGTPTFINGILKGALPNDLRTLRLGVTGAEKCPEHVYNGLRTACPGMTILEGYGITECSPVVSVNRPEHPVPFSIGRIMPSVEYRIVDEATGADCPPGRQGMLLVRGPSIFEGYLGHDGPSPFATVDGKSYYRTGDLVAADETGTLFFKGRLKRFVKLGGEMISMPAIEEILGAAFRREDGDGDGPVLAVEALSDDSPELTLFTTLDIGREEANRAIRAAGLSPLHNIRRVAKVESIPVLGTGKTDYRALKIA